MCLEAETGLPVDPPVGPEACNDGSLVLPILEHAHDEENCSGSIIGGYVYHGVQSPAFAGLYIYGDFCTGEIRAAVRVDGDTWSVVDTFQSGMSITSFGEDEQAELYLSDLVSGMVLKVTTQRPIPSLTLLSPFRQVAGGGKFELSALGGGFSSDSELHWNGEALPTSVFNSSRLRAVVEPEVFAEVQAVEITVFTPSPGGGRSEPSEFLIEAATGPAPTLNEGGVVSAATFAPEQGIAPGSILSIFGVDMAAWAEATRTNLLATSLGGGVLTFSGVDGTKLAGDVRAPFFFASPTQINALAPWELEGSSEVTLAMQVGGAVSNTVTVPVATYAPGIFTLTADGMGQAAATISATGGVVAAQVDFLEGLPSRPAQRGEFVALSTTGLGPVTLPPASGDPAERPFPATTTTPVVMLGEVQAQVTFSGIAPNFVGLYQLNIRIPSDAPSGDTVPVKVTIGGVESNTATIAIE